MHASSRTVFLSAVVAITVACLSCLRASDWPAYRHDLARSGVTDEQIQTPLHLQWSHTASHPPKPAWPEPGRELNRVAFDYAFEVVSAGGLVYFGSSSDHTIRCLDMSTGKERWSYITGGPVRFAPAVENGRVFVASDDGWLYCLSASDGKLLWRFSGGPRQEMLIGNEQLISRWPLRSGVAVENGTVYISAGMWPSEAVYIYALSASDGSVVWMETDTGSSYKKQPHPPSHSFLGVTPQGYILGSRDRILIPTGRNMPAGYNRQTGEQVYYRSDPKDWGSRWGGCEESIANDLLFVWNTHLGPEINVLTGEYEQDPKDGMVSFDVTTCEQKRDLPGKLSAVVSDGKLYASGSGKVTAYDFNAWLGGAKPADCTKWETPHGRAYSLTMAGSTLVAGGRGTVTAIAAQDGKVLWTSDVKGQARSLAAADGRLLVSTTEGRIYCFGADQVSGEPPAITTTPEVQALAEDEPTSSRLAESILLETGKKAGYCLVLGAGDGGLLQQLARQSELQVCCLEADAGNVAAMRRKLDAAGLNGVRVTVHQGTLADVRLPECFADLVVFIDPPSKALKENPAAELYRLLHPLGGTAYITLPQKAGWLARRQFTGWLERGQIPQGETEFTARAVKVVRGPLPGAGSWTHQYADAGRTGASVDTRLALPLKVLWFGGPGPLPMVNRHWAGPAPLCVNGRLFVIGEHELNVADAYTGRGLWRYQADAADGKPVDLTRWPVGRTGGNVVVDETSVYIAADKSCLRLDAATGKTVRTYEMPPLPATIPDDLRTKATWAYLSVDGDAVLGTAGIGDAGMAVFILDKETGQPRWVHATTGSVGINAVTMDASRVYLLDRASTEDTEKARRRGQEIKIPSALVALDRASGNAVWETGKDMEERTELRLAQGVLLATGNNGMTGVAAVDGQPLYARSVKVAKFPVIIDSTVYIQPSAYDLRTGADKPRKDPFTGRDIPWTFTRSYGCGQVSGSSNVLMFRSSTLGVCDLAGDSGTHNFAGIRAGCYTNAIVAAGLLLMPPGDAGCTCSYSLQTTVALASADKQEDWSLLYPALPSTPVRSVALNLGAPGDRVDGDGVAWLAMPRPDTGSQRRDIAVPFRFEFAEGYGPYHASSDDTRIGGTTRPWIYTSGLKGLTRAVFDLEIMDRAVKAWPLDQAPAIDGSFTEACWDGYHAVDVPEGASVTLRYDDENLYLGYGRRAARDAAGMAVPWKVTASGKDSEIWQGDSFEAYLTSDGDRAKRYLHVGLSASGGRYDALWTYVTPALPVLAIPKVAVTVDGKAEDWGDAGLRVVSLPGKGGGMRDANDFDPCPRVGWCDEGVAVLVEVKDSVLREATNPEELWTGDSVELFVTPKPGEQDHYQLVVSPGVDPKQPEVLWRFYDARKNPGTGPLAARTGPPRKTESGYIVEVLLPWANLGITPTVGMEFGMQIFVNDVDADGKQFRALWHQAGHPKDDPLAYQTFRLATEPASVPLTFTRSAKANNTTKLFSAANPPFLTVLPSLGADLEDRGADAVWSGTAAVTPDLFAAEIAIPWRTLTDAGIGRGKLMVNLASRGPLRDAPEIGKGFERLTVVPESMAEPRLVSVRLHFAEIEDVSRGGRVFDVKLQDKVVLKDFDVVKAAGGSNRAVVKQFDRVMASRAVFVELIPKPGTLTQQTAPIISGIEILPGGE